MKKLLIVLVGLVLGFTQLHAGAFEKVAKSRATKVMIMSDKPLSVGFNILNLSLLKNGKIPQGVKVSVKAFMPAMPGMPKMEFYADAKELGNGKFSAKVNLAMSGTWQLHIFITPLTGKKTRVKTSLTF